MADEKSVPGGFGLIAFGALQIVLGLLCALLVLYIASGSELAVRQGPSGGATLASGLMVYGVATAFFVGVGVGSIKRKRWAVALSAVVSAMWLAAGVVATLLLLVVLPTVEQRMHVSAPATIAAALIAGVVLPLTILLFYRRPAVRAACETSDIPRWTDRVPLPVLAVMIVLAFGCLAMLANLANPVIAIFGTNITGAPAAITLLALAILSAWLVVQCYRLKESAWWTLVLLQVAGCVIAAISLARGGSPKPDTTATGFDMSEVYRSPFFIAIIVGSWLAYFAFLLYLRRYFVYTTSPRTRQEDAAPHFT